MFDDIAQVIKGSLSEKARIVTSFKGNHSLSKSIYIILGANDLYEDIPKDCHYIVYQFEQISSNNSELTWFTDKYLDILKNAIQIYDYSNVNCKLLKNKFDLDSEWLPLRYHPILGSRDDEFKSTNKKYDILFCGSINNRRKILLNKLKSLGLKVKIGNNLWRKSLKNAIQNSRLCLNFHYYQNATLETARLLTLLKCKGKVISEYSSDNELDNQYREYVHFGNYDELINLCIDKNLEKKKTFINSKSFEFPLNYLKDYISEPNETDSLPEPDNLEFEIAETSHSKSDEYALKLPAEPKREMMLPVTIVTITRNRPILFKMAIRNFNLTKYPKLEWVIVDDSIQSMQSDIPNSINKIKYIHIPKNDEEKLSISDKRNIAVEHASNNIIVHMDDDDYYYPDSVYARVKLLITNNRIDCVGISEYGVYHLLNDYSFKINTKQLSEASMCYYKSFWETRKFREHNKGEGVPFLKGRRSRVLTMPFQFCMIAITHGRNVTSKLREIEETNNNTLFNSWDHTTQSFIIKLYRKLRL